MLALALALLVLGSLGLVLRGIRRAWPGAMPWRRLLLIELVVLAGWLLGGNLAASWREAKAREAWRAIERSAEPATRAPGRGLSPAAVELVTLARALGIRLDGARTAPGSPSEPDPDDATRAARAAVVPFVEAAVRRAGDPVPLAPVELRAWLILRDEALRGLERRLLAREAIDWGAPADGSPGYSPVELHRLHAVLLADALERMRIGDAGGAGIALEAASALTGSLRGRPETTARQQALAQDRRLLGALRLLEPVPAGFERTLDAIQAATQPLAVLPAENLGVLEEMRRPATTLRGTILELDGAELRGEPRPPLARWILRLSGGDVPIERLAAAVAAERRRADAPFHRFVQGPLERPYVRLVVADHVLARAQVLSAALAASDPCGAATVVAAPRRASWSPLAAPGDFAPRLVRAATVLGVELELTRLVERARFMRGLDKGGAWPGGLGGDDSRTCPGRHFVLAVEDGHAEVRLEPSAFAEKEAVVSFRMAGR